MELSLETKETVCSSCKGKGNLIVQFIDSWGIYKLKIKDTHTCIVLDSFWKKILRDIS
jgi:hypothetical protein